MDNAAPSVLKSPRQLWRAWWVVLIAALYFFYEFIQMNMFSSLQGSLESAFQFSSFQFALVTCFYFLADTILMYPAGAILDYFSSKSIMLLGMGVCVLGTFLISGATSAWFLVLARFLAGTASAVCFLSILRLAAEWFPPAKLGFVSGVVVAFAMLGGAISQHPLAWLISHVGWREALRDVAILGVFIFLLIALFVKDAKPHERQAALLSEYSRDQPQFHWWQVMKRVAGNRYNWLAGLYISTMNLPIMLLAGLFATSWMEQGEGLSYQDAAQVSGMIFIGTIVGSIFFGYLTDWLGSRRKPMLIAAWLSLLLVVGLLSINHLGFWAYMVVFFILGFITAGQVIGYPVTREVNPGEISGAAFGFISVLIMLLPTLLQPLTGYLLTVGWHGLQQQHVPVYSLEAYDRILWVLISGFVVSIVCAWKLPETYR